MSKEQIMEKLNEILRDVLENDSITADEDTEFWDIVGWDSIENMNIILSAEEDFGIKFNVNEVSSMKTVGTMAEIILGRMCK